MEKKIPIRYASLNLENSDLEFKEKGINAIALVDSPAMLTEWLMFSEQKSYEFKMAFNEEQKIITAPLIVADLPILRIVDNEEFYVVYKKDVNMQILQKYMADQNQKKVKLTHDTDKISKGVFVFEIFMSDESRGIVQPKGFDLPDGTIFCSMKINDAQIWNDIKTKKVNGISLEGYFDLEQKTTLDENEIEAIIKEII
jgi:hypothetical protein